MNWLAGWPVGCMYPIWIIVWIIIWILYESYIDSIWILYGSCMDPYVDFYMDLISIFIWILYWSLYWSVAFTVRWQLPWPCVDRALTVRWRLAISRWPLLCTSTVCKTSIGVMFWNLIRDSIVNLNLRHFNRNTIVPKKLCSRIGRQGVLHKTINIS